MYVYIYVGIDKLSTVESVQQWAPSKSLVMGGARFSLLQNQIRPQTQNLCTMRLIGVLSVTLHGHLEGSREVVKRLRTFIALAEDLGFFPAPMPCSSQTSSRGFFF